MVSGTHTKLLLLFSFLLFEGSAQIFNPLQVRSYRIIPDTLVLDTLSLVPGSVTFRTFPAGDSALAPEINYKLHALIFKKAPDSLIVSYRRFPYNFEKVHFHKDQSALYSEMVRRGNPFTIRYDKKGDDLFQNDGLSKNGNISRGITFGNNQDVVVNSNLNLQVSGKLTPEIDMVMAATDNNIPFQADGTTAQLQEFDKVFIQLSNESTKMIVGDYQLSRPQNSYFMNFYKRAQGVYLDNSSRDTAGKTPLLLKTSIAGAVSRGKFSRQVFFGTENNQGPYRLKGADNEPFIIVLSGTEKIYIDGRLMQRGQENDYIIDYNTGELTFTAKQLITKDRRIVAEFQYAERNYARSLFFFGEEIQSKKAKIYLNYFSEQDNKNKPLLQNLSQPEKDVLIALGDTLEKAYATGVQEAVFNNSEVFYRMADTLVNGIVYKAYVYSTDPEVAKYRLRFSNVGYGHGNYEQVSTSANGRVFRWVSPVNGLPRGSFEPVIPLVTPKKQQMLTGGFNYSVTPDHQLSGEGVYTKYDINRFSTSDQGNDEGSGVKVVSQNSHSLSDDPSAAKLIYNVGYEFLQKQFTQVERFRGIEFERDWNRPLGTLLTNDQHLGSVEMGLVKTSRASLGYVYNILREGESYEGRRHNVNGGFTGKDLSGSYKGSYLETRDDAVSQKSGFYRHKAVLSQRLDRIRIGYSDDFEKNLFRNSSTGVLSGRAYQFWEWEGSVSNADSSANNIKVFYRERRDRLAYGEELGDSTFARNAGIQASVFSIRNNPFTVLVTYRKLELTRNIRGDFLKPDNTLLNRLEYNPRYFNGFITAGLFYETGYGLENKREYSYIEVAPGQGQYTWIDYNRNDIKEVNEFETAFFADQQKYIRVYTPTNSYVKVLQNQLSLSANVRPSSVLTNRTKPLNRFVNRWSLQTAVRLDNKISDNGSGNNFNPFVVAHDTSVLATNNNLRQSVFFNQSSAVFGADYSYTRNRSRQLLTNGIETRELLSNTVRWRLNFFRSWMVSSENTVSEKRNASAFFSARNYLITAYESEDRLSFQPNTVFRLSAIYKYTDKMNRIEGGTEKALINSYGAEMRYNQTEKGSFTARADMIRIGFTGSENSSVAYEMLNGLSNGDNFTWELTYQRNLNSNLQISINYSGRKTPASSPVHLGGAQIRAFF